MSAHQSTGASAAVSIDPEVMGGLPCFTGTRVPVENVLGSLDQGIAWERVVAVYPGVTKELVAAARDFALQHPQHFPKLLREPGAPVFAEIAHPRLNLPSVRAKLHRPSADAQ